MANWLVFKRGRGVWSPIYLYESKSCISDVFQGGVGKSAYSLTSKCWSIPIWISNFADIEIENMFCCVWILAHIFTDIIYDNWSNTSSSTQIFWLCKTEHTIFIIKFDTNIGLQFLITENNSEFDLNWSSRIFPITPTPGNATQTAFSNYHSMGKCIDQCFAKSDTVFCKLLKLQVPQMKSLMYSHRSNTMSFNLICKIWYSFSIVLKLQVSVVKSSMFSHRSLCNLIIIMSDHNW